MVCGGEGGVGGEGEAVAAVARIGRNSDTRLLSFLLLPDNLRLEKVIYSRSHSFPADHVVPRECWHLAHWC